MNNFSKIIHLSRPNLAYFAPWRASILLFEYFSSTENLRKLRKLSSIVVRRARNLRILVSEFFVTFVIFVVRSEFLVDSITEDHRARKFAQAAITFKHNNA